MRNKGRNTQQEPAFTGPGVSELLKTSRERIGQDLQTVAHILRIRLVYLEAIEEGRYDALPGKTYVVGFVRAYAEHLGLDSEEVVRRFKAEVNGLEGRSELMFPSPVTEQSVPGGAIILIGLIILGAAYGGWYFLSSQNRSVAELVPDLPAKFAEMVDKVKESKNDDSAAPQEAAPQTETQGSEQSAQPSTPVSEADTQDMAEKAREAVEKAASEESTPDRVIETVKVEEGANTAQESASNIAQTAVNENTETVVQKVEDTAQAVAEKVEEAVSASEEKIEETAQAVVAEVEKPAQVEEQAVVVEEKPVAKPMTQKIVLKAVDYSWVQVTDSDGAVLHTQGLNEGEEYQVPQTQGLILRTGNAGGLEIFVDGKKVPAIGEAGEVRRKVLLSPEKLVAGKAVES